jgi:hypothetical protein
MCGAPRALGTLDRDIACVSGDLRDATLAWSMGGSSSRIGQSGMRGVRGVGLRAQVQRRPRVERMPLLGLRRGRGEKAGRSAGIWRWSLESPVRLRVRRRVGTLPCCNYPATCSPWPRLRLAGEGYCWEERGRLARGRPGAPRSNAAQPQAGVRPSPAHCEGLLPRLWGGGVVPVAMYFQVATPSDSVVGGAGR